MNACERTIVKAQEITPIVEKLVEANVPFAMWSNKDVEMYDALIESLQKTGFYVVVLKDIESIAKCFNVSNPFVTIVDDDLHNLSLTKATGRKVAVVINNVERLTEHALRFVYRVVDSRIVTNIHLDKEDVIVSIGKLNDAGRVESTSYSNHFYAVNSRFQNYVYE